MHKKIYLTLFIFFQINFYITAQVPAFPGAEGDGKFTSGGRGGRIIAVTNLNDDGPGSFRDAVSQEGARIIIFKVSGTIELQSELEIKNGDITIAGQSAPGDGICIRNYQTTVNAENVIIRFLRFRLGDEKKQVADALSIMNSKNVIVDHCSLSWGIDEVFSFYDSENTTMQWCIISESLCNSFHPKGEHGYGGIWGGKNASFHHNLLAHNSSRNPRFNGSRTKYSPEEENVDFRNNVIYNWGFNSAYGGESASYNLVNNYYKAGPATHKKIKNRIIEPWDDESKWYISGNYVDGFPETTDDNWNGGVQGDYADESDLRSCEPFEHILIPEEDAQTAYEKVLAHAGASLKRDKIDERIIREVKEGIATVNDGIINSQTEVGGWPELISAPAAADSDSDGMPDDWEITNNLNPDDYSDASLFSQTGYTYIEDYLNSLVILPENEK